MKLLVKVKDDKAEFILELLSYFKFVKVNPIIAKNTETVEGVKQAVKEMKLIKKGKLKGIAAKDLIKKSRRKGS